MNIALLLVVYQLMANPSDSMVTRINQERFYYGRYPLSENEQLQKSAKAKACDIDTKGYWSHTSPDGREPWDFIHDAGYTYKYAGENLERNMESDEVAMIRLMDSPTHKANIISEKFTEVGIGRCGRVVVQHFGSK